jgi:hypothetical protein
VGSECQIRSTRRCGGTLDESWGFTGKVANFRGQDFIDLADITFGAQTTLGYAGNGTGGTLKVKDGVHSARIALLGSYMASSFAAASDGHGGTLISTTAETASWQSQGRHRPSRRRWAQR